MIIYRMGNDLDLDAVIALYKDSTLGERRPIDDRARMSVMIANANLVITAWDGDLLEGIPDRSRTSATSPTCRTWRFGLRISGPGLVKS
ncbi:MAG TPA: hypothetical protein VFS96_04310 [Nitrolancea sp.]|nr:hypothetical protein [Nitrolancea sp.]